MRNLSLGVAALLLLTAAGAPSAQAGSTIDRTVLPIAGPPFAGRIGDTLKESAPDFPKPVEAPAGAPNVLIVILDDVGFGHAGAFGGAVSTPTMDSLAAEGLRFNSFHTTALCSPTRAALLTGRNHHSVGTGVVIEMGTGFPGYTGIVPGSAAALPKSCARTVMPPPPSGNGTTRLTRKSAPPVPSTAGPPAEPGASTISMAS